MRSLPTAPNPLHTPCIRVCTLDENDICVGCYRHVDEITAWHSADVNQRQAILDKCDARRQAKPTPPRY